MSSEAKDNGSKDNNLKGNGLKGNGLKDNVAESADSSAAAQHDKHPTVLIVEDNAEIRSYLRDSLQDEYTIVEAANGKDGLEKITNIQQEGKEIDLILSDVMMPLMDGIEFCKAVKTNIMTSHIPFIILSAKVDIQEQLEGLQVGAEDYIPKPFSMMLIRQKIKNILRSRQLMISRFKQSPVIEPKKIATSPIDEQWIAKAMSVAEAHIADEHFSSDLFAREMLMSRTALYTKMKAMTGEGVKEFIRRIRFNKALKLLEEGQLSVAEISYEVGFSSPSYFSTSFKKQFGYLPTEVRS